MKKNLLFAMFLPMVIHAQNGRVGINTDTPQATLEIQPSNNNLMPTADTNEGIIAPKLSKTRIAKIANDKLVDGTLVYAKDIVYTGNNTKVEDITEKGYYFYNGTKWVRLASNSNSGGGGSITPSTDLCHKPHCASNGGSGGGPYEGAIIPQMVELTWEILKDGQTTFPLTISSDIPYGLSYAAYTSPQVSFPVVDGGYRLFHITYPAGITNDHPITATLHIDGNQQYLPKVVTDSSQEQIIEIPLYFNAVAQNNPLQFKLGVNAVTNIEYGQTYVYPIRKIANKEFTLINLGAYYAEQANAHPEILWEWMFKIESNNNYHYYDRKAYGSLFQWQRPRDGHELVNFTSWSGAGSNPYTQTTSTLSNNPNWTAGHSLFIFNNKGNNGYNKGNSWVESSINHSSSNKNLWQAGGSNNPCPQGYHVPLTSEWYALKNELNNEAVMSKYMLLGTHKRQYFGDDHPIAWSSDMNNFSNAKCFIWHWSSHNEFYGINPTNASAGLPVRCIKD